MSPTSTSLVWVDGAVIQSGEMTEAMKVEFGRLLGISPAVYLRGRENLAGQIRVLARCATTLGYTGVDPESLAADLGAAVDRSDAVRADATSRDAAISEAGCLLVALVPGPDSHKAAPPGSSWFVHTEPLPAGDSSAPNQPKPVLGLSRNARNQASPAANLLLWDDLELDMADRGDCDRLVWLNLDGKVACVDQGSLLVTEGESVITPPLDDGAIESGWRARLVESGEVIEASITLERLQAADKVAVLTPQGDVVEAELSATGMASLLGTRRGGGGNG